MFVTTFFALRPWRSAGFVLSAAAMWIAAASAHAAQPKSSLEFVPADAHVYVSVSRLGEHARSIAKSNWWAEVQKSAAFRRAIQGVLPGGDPDGDPDVDAELPAAAQIFADLSNLPLYSLAGEMASEEIFFYSDRRAVDLVALSSEFSENMYVAYTSIGFMFATGQFDFFNADIENIMAERILRPVRDNLDKVAVPHLVVGFKIKDPKNAELVLARQVDRFREMLSDLALNAPSDKVLEETVDGANCWIWRFEGESIPWPAVFDISGDVPPAIEPVFAHLRKLKGVVTLCVHDGYVLLAVADSPAWIEKLGTGPLLADREDFAPLKKLADRPITGIGYTSREARAAWVFDETDVANLIKSVKHALEASSVAADTSKAVGRALDGMADDLRPHLPRPGSMLTIAHTSDQGIEFTTFDRSEPIHVDGSKPLAILDHVGPAPIAFWAGRGKGTEECYRAWSKTVAGGYELIEKYAFPAMQTEVQTQVVPFFNKMKVVAKRFDRAMRDLVLPPLEGGDAALVLSARQPDSPWTLGGPESEVKVAMPLPAWAVTVKDTDQLQAGIKEMHGVYNDAMSAYAETAPFAEPFTKLEDPKSREFDEGTIHWHVLPKQWGADKRIAPNYGLAKNLAVFSLVPLDTRDMLATTTLKLPAPLDDRSQPLAAATYIDVPRACEVAAGVMLLGAPFRYEWVEEVHTDEDGNIFTERRQVPVAGGGAASAKDFQQWAALAKAMPSYASATKVEGSTTVTHGILRIVDLPAPAKTEPQP